MSKVQVKLNWFIKPTVTHDSDLSKTPLNIILNSGAELIEGVITMVPRLIPQRINLEATVSLDSSRTLWDQELQAAFIKKFGMGSVINHPTLTHPDAGTTWIHPETEKAPVQETPEIPLELLKRIDHKLDLLLGRIQKGVTIVTPGNPQTPNTPFPFNSNPVNRGSYGEED